jgi:hypothetical protein
MGVLACDRKDCENIMCDTCIDGRYYICYDCEKEFKEYLIKENISPTTEGEIIREIEMFMATTKGVYNRGDDITVDDFFNKNRRN